MGPPICSLQTVKVQQWWLTLKNALLITQGACREASRSKTNFLPLLTGKNAIFRAVVKGVPAPEVKWKRAKGEINDPAKYLMFYSPATSEHILQVKINTAEHTQDKECNEMYKCAVGARGESISN